MSDVQEFQVSGMTCGHCVQAVTSEFEALPGVRSVEVLLVPGEVSTIRVDAASTLAQDDVRAAVDEAGYVLVG